MPWRIALIFIWLAGLGWWCVREMVPRWLAGRMEYQQLLARRASDEPTLWKIMMGDQKVGNIVSNVHPAPNGGFSINSQASVSTSLIPNLGAEAFLQIQFRADVSPLGTLKNFDAKVHIEGSSMSLSVRGDVQGDTATLLVFAGRQQMGSPTTIRLDPKLPLGQSLAPPDRLPGLWVGRRWTSKTIDPQSLITRGGIFSGAAVSTKDAVHTVIGIETISWNDEPSACFVVEDKLDGINGKTWVRQTDGQVLRQEAGFGNARVVMELDPQTFRTLR
jgi:hypothetical protein